MRLPQALRLAPPLRQGRRPTLRPPVLVPPRPLPGAACRYRAVPRVLPLPARGLQVLPRFRRQALASEQEHRERRQAQALPAWGLVPQLLVRLVPVWLVLPLVPARPVHSPVVLLMARRRGLSGRAFLPLLHRIQPVRPRRPWPGWPLQGGRPSPPSRKDRSAARLPVRLSRGQHRQYRLWGAILQAVRPARGYWVEALRCRPWGLRALRVPAACRRRGPARRRVLRPVIRPSRGPSSSPSLRFSRNPRCGTVIRRHPTPRVRGASSLPAALCSSLPAPIRNSRPSRRRVRPRRVACSVPASRIRGQPSPACLRPACVLRGQRVSRGLAIREHPIRPVGRPSAHQPVVRACHRCRRWGRPLWTLCRPGSSLGRDSVQ